MKKVVIIAGVVIVAVAAVIFFGVPWLFPRLSEQIHNLNNQTTKNLCNGWPEPDSYAYGNKIITYGCHPKQIFNDADNYTTVYISDGASKTDIIKQFPAYYPNTDIKFEKTSISSIVLLKIYSGEFAFSISYYYIDLETNKVLFQITNHGFPYGNGYLTVQKTSSQNWKIEPVANDQTCQENGTSMFTGIAINGAIQNITQPIRIQCDKLIDARYTTSLQLEYLGLSKDFNKIFFSISTNEDGTGSFKKNYSLNMENQIIVPENPNNTLIDNKN